MKEQLISHDTRMLAKKKGCKLEGVILEDSPGCTQSLLQKWIRENLNINIEIIWDPSYEIEKNKWSDAIFRIEIVDLSYKKEWKGYSINYQRRDGNQLTYEQSLEKALQEVLKKE